MLKRMYEKMVLIRRLEEVLTELFQRGALSGTTHSCIGQEAVAVGVINAINRDDIVTSNHRGHGHFLAFTDDLEGFILEIMGKKNGLCGGIGGSQHIHKGSFYANGITGGMIPVATGMAFAEKLKQSGKRVLAFMGDGAVAQGVTYESWNMASLWKLPILYVIENNQYAMSTSLETHLSGSLVMRPEPFGIKVTEVVGMDVEAIFEVASKIATEITEGVMPQVLICNTYRFCGHSKSDNLCYRTRAEEAKWLEKDPIKLAGEKLTKDDREFVLSLVEERIKRGIEASEVAEFLDIRSFMDSP
jgi:acetoin:2,6-dichlorophenolindophenol oxidoreductase subunit alpha